MKPIIISFRLLLCALLVFLAAPQAAALVHSLVEDFSSKEYCDTANTTALWDTTSGEIKFPPFSPSLAGSVYTPDAAWDVEVAGDHAYVAAWGSGLQVVSIDQPDSLAIVGSYDSPGLAIGVAVSGNYAFLADYASGLQVVDITDPANPSMIGNYITAGTAVDVAVSGNYAYVAGSSVGVYVINVTIPFNPTPAGFTGTPGSAEAIVVAGDYAYVADKTSGLQVIDISNPATPYIAGSLDTPGYAYGVTVEGDHAYVADYGSGLHVVDISDPTAPSLAGTRDTPGLAWDVAVTGDYAYVADGTDGVQIVDISDPAGPSIIKAYDTPDWAYGVDLDGPHAYVADRNAGLRVVEIAGAFQEVRPGPACLLSDSPQAVVVSGDYAFVALGTEGIAVVDISDPFGPSVVGNCPSWSGLSYQDDPVLRGDVLFMTTNVHLDVIDVSTPTAPACVGSLNTTYGAGQFAVSGNYGYLPHTSHGVLVIDVSVPTAPAAVGTCATLGTAQAAAVAGDHVYVADGGSGLSVLDISTPTAPVVVGNYDDTNDCRRVKVSGDLAFADFGGRRVTLVDISDPLNPAELGHCYAPEYLGDWAVSGNLLHMTGSEPDPYGYYQIAVYDITDPTSPVMLGESRPDEYSRRFDVAGDHAYSASTVGLSYLLRTFQFFYRRFEEENDTARSTEFHRSGEEIRRVRLTTGQVDSVAWEIAADTSFFSWEPVSPGAGWQILDRPGHRLIWRSTHRMSRIGQNPACSALLIEWLYNFAFIDSVVDVPGDQGGWVRVHFTRSTLDFVDEIDYPVEAYDVFRRVDNAALRMRVADALAGSEGSSRSGYDQLARSAAPGHSAAPGRAGAGDNRDSFPRRVRVGERVFITSAGGPLSQPPAGVWEVVGTVHAHQQDQYIYLAPTLADSSSDPTYSVYCLSTETTTPSVYYFSPPDSGYSVDNLAPSPPAGLSMPSATELGWSAVPEGDFDYYTVYGSEEPAPGEGEVVIGYTIDTYMDVAGHVYGYYHVTATDFAQNEGDASSIENAYAGVGSEALPAAYALMQNTPNPFGAGTAIRFDLPVAGHTRVTVYDIEGRAVATLTDETRDAGRHSLTWDGRDSSGRRVGPGLYLVRMDAGCFTGIRKMMLLR